MIGQRLPADVLGCIFQELETFSDVRRWALTCTSFRTISLSSDQWSKSSLFHRLVHDESERKPREDFLRMIKALGASRPQFCQKICIHFFNLATDKVLRQFLYQIKKEERNLFFDSIGNGDLQRSTLDLGMAAWVCTDSKDRFRWLIEKVKGLRDLNLVGIKSITDDDLTFLDEKQPELVSLKLGSSTEITGESFFRLTNMQKGLKELHLSLMKRFKEEHVPSSNKFVNLEMFSISHMPFEQDLQMRKSPNGTL